MKLTLPIIALTADVTTVDVAKCKEVGMNDYISKPVDERLLYSKLINMIKKPVLIIEHTEGASGATDKFKYVDMSYLSKLTQSNPKLMTEIITVYLKQTPDLVATMKQSFTDRKWDVLGATIHKMIPSFAIMGIHSDTTLIAHKIQEYARQLEHTSELNELILNVENVCLQACMELETALINLNK